MSILRSFVLVTALLGLSSVATPSFAGKVCMNGHFHFGSGPGSSKRAATKAAIRSWAGFTSFEYGSAWANFRIAKNRVVSCDYEDGEHRCSARAIPCRYR